MEPLDNGCEGSESGFGYKPTRIRGWSLAKLIEGLECQKYFGNDELHHIYSSKILLDYFSTDKFTMASIFRNLFKFN